MTSTEILAAVDEQLSDPDCDTFDFRALRGLLPDEPLPRLIREYCDVRGALETYERMDGATADLMAVRQRVVGRTVAALGFWNDWSAASRLLDRMEAHLRQSPLQYDSIVADELVAILRPLLDYFRDPRDFFTRVAPALFAADFDLATLTSAGG